MTTRSPAPAVVQAAGGVLWRRGAWNRVEVALVHRPRYDDWSLPKGKAKRSENLMVTALREVEEETGTPPRLGPFLTRFSYTPGVPRTTRSGQRGSSSGPPSGRSGSQNRTAPPPRTKVVGYWAMAAEEESDFVAGSEVDALDWLTVDDAHERLSYPLDRTVLDRFVQTPLGTSAVVVVRAGHSAQVGPSLSAGPSSPVGGAPLPGAVQLRSLDPRGRDEAAALVPLVRSAGPQALLSAPSPHCVETLAPAAEQLGLAVEVDGSLDHPDAADLRAVADRAVRVAAGGLGVGLCVTGSAVAPLARALVGRASGPDPGEIRLRKGGWWVLHLSHGRYVAAERHDPDR